MVPNCALIEIVRWSITPNTKRRFQRPVRFFSRCLGEGIKYLPPLPSPLRTFLMEFLWLIWKALVLTVEALRAMMITCVNRHFKDDTESVGDREDPSPYETPLTKAEDSLKRAWFMQEAEPTTLFQATAKQLITPARMGTTFAKPPSLKVSAKLALIDFDSDMESILMGAEASAPSEEAESQPSQGKSFWSRFTDSLTNPSWCSCRVGKGA